MSFFQQYPSQEQQANAQQQAQQQPPAPPTPMTDADDQSWVDITPPPATPITIDNNNSNNNATEQPALQQQQQQQQQQQSSQQPGIAFSARAQHSRLGAEAATTIVASRLVARELVQENARQPLDCVVVIDRSGSMRGKKIKMCMETCRFIVQNLGKYDRFALISFDNTVKTECPLSVCDEGGKYKANECIGRLRVGGSTNLSGGLFEGLTHIAQTNTADNHSGGEERIQSVLLLTDGEANQGIRDTDSLLTAMNQLITTTTPNVSVHTFGFGAGHNADMLRQIASSAQGGYYFIENADSVSSAFAECVGGLMSVVAQNIRVAVEPHEGSGVEVLRVLTKRPVTDSAGAGKIVALGDMYAEEQRDILVEIRLPEHDCSGDGETPSVAFTLNYVDVTAGQMVTATCGVGHERTLKAVDAAASQDRQIATQHCRILAAEAIDAATASANSGRLEEARATLEHTIEHLRRTMSQLDLHASLQPMRASMRDSVDSEEAKDDFTPLVGGAGVVNTGAAAAGADANCAAMAAMAPLSQDATLLADLINDVTEAKSNLRDVATYRSVGQYTMSNISHSHHHQRSCTSSSSMRSSYKTRSKAMMQDRSEQG